MVLLSGISQTINPADIRGVASTSFIPLACRAMEASRPRPILVDTAAAELFSKMGGSKAMLRGMSKVDQASTVIRNRQFDHYARQFLAAHPGGLVVDIGCGFDTRFHRLDDGRMTWLGVDLPEIIALRRKFLPDSARDPTIAQSMLDSSWLDIVEQKARPTIFLAEGVFPYFSEEKIEPLIQELAARFSGGELVFDAFSVLSVNLHNKTHAILKEHEASLKWGIDDPAVLEAWGLRLLEQWSYFDQYEPRFGIVYWLKIFPSFARMNLILHYRLGD